jgi:hypothetical protein
MSDPLKLRQVRALIDELIETAQESAQGTIESLQQQLRDRDAKIAEWREAEHRLSDAYLRLRALLEAFDIPAGVTAEQVWEHTEDKLKKLIANQHESTEQK